VLVPEEELSVQIAQVYRVEVDDMDFAKAAQAEILEEFATDAAGADHEDTSLFQSQLNP
jgi:hypothetical protein